MKARGYLELLIEENPTDEHAAALRELDQLLETIALQLNNNTAAGIIVYFPVWKERLAQAGYGEK